MTLRVKNSVRAEVDLVAEGVDRVGVETLETAVVGVDVRHRLEGVVETLPFDAHLEHAQAREDRRALLVREVAEAHSVFPPCRYDRVAL